MLVFLAATLLSCPELAERLQRRNLPAEEAAELRQQADQRCAGYAGIPRGHIEAGVVPSLNAVTARLPVHRRQFGTMAETDGVPSGVVAHAGAPRKGAPREIVQTSALAGLLSPPLELAGAPRGSAELETAFRDRVWEKYRAQAPVADFLGRNFGLYELGSRYQNWRNFYPGGQVELAGVNYNGQRYTYFQCNHWAAAIMKDDALKRQFAAQGITLRAASRPISNCPPLNICGRDQHDFVEGVDAQGQVVVVLDPWFNGPRLDWR